MLSKLRFARSTVDHAGQRVHRGVLGIAGALATTGLLVGCAPFFPVRGNEQPLQMTVQGGDVLFRWCGAETVPAKSIRGYFRTESGDRSYIDVLNGTGDMKLAPGDEFSSLVPPPGIEYDLARPIPVTDEPITMFVFAGSTTDEIDALEVTYNGVIVSDLEGKWMFPSGEVSAEACEIDEPTGGAG